MELGTLQIQIFVSLVVVLGTAFVAFLCDFLKGNNEQLRERNIEMQVRQEEQRRFGVWEPAKLLKGIEALLKNTPPFQHGAPPVVAPVEAPLEPAQSPSWEQPAEPAAVKTGTWASKEELEKLAERAARIRERHEARKASEETTETEPAAPTVLPVALASISGIAEAVAVTEAEAAPEQVEGAPEQVEATLAAAETPPLAAETEGVEQEPQAASAQSEAGGVLEWVTNESVTAEAALAGESEEAEAAVEAEPVAVEAESVAVEAEPVVVEAEPVVVEAEPVAVEAEPVAVEAEPVAEEAEVLTIEPEAPALEAEAPAIETEAQAPEPEAPAIEAEADGSVEWAGEPVAGLQMALPHEIPQVAEPQMAELARVDEEAILAAQETPRLPEGELPLAPIEAMQVEAVEDVVELDAAEPAVVEVVEDEPVADEAEQDEAGGEPEFLRVRVLPIDQPVKEEEEAEEVAGAALEVDGRKLIAAPEAEAPEAEAPEAEAPELEAIPAAAETEAPETEAPEIEAAEIEAAELTTEPAAAEAIEAGAEITSLHESLAKEEPGLPAGLHDVTLLRERMKANLNFEGVAVSIGINDYDALRQKLDTSAGAESMASVERLIQSMLKGSDFACRFQDDEFILLFPGEADSSAQRRLFQISEKLWDFQLRSLGHHSIMFSWGGLEVKRDTLSDAVASARERMFQTKRNRTGAIEMRKRVVNG